MSTVLEGEGRKNEVENGVKEFAEDIETLLAYSNTFESGPFTEQQIRNHFKEDESYFEDDLDYVKDALDYLQEQNRIKPDFVSDEEGLKNAYSFDQYSI